LWDDQGELSKGKVLESRRNQCILNIYFSPELGMQAETQKITQKIKTNEQYFKKKMKTGPSGSGGYVHLDVMKLI
jgi:hypothetical protein